ncbi:uncharacterized protein LOC133095646 [Eubalaena glacialis]|uniref:uncharacterized protein LOC133095646 n=1 Tax=Eubalaena glacialis TaxID=27606 RepID=UPI002A5A393C|nr:uncharacterized protein LOC133095646 [Eubalaena glacialis]
MAVPSLPPGATPVGQPRSPLPPRGPRSRAGLGETRPPPRGPPSPGCAHRRVKGADRPPRCALAVLRAARPAARRREEEERAEYTADIISTTVAEPYRTCFTAGGSKTSPVEQQPELQQPQDTVSLPLPPLPHATPDPFTLYRGSCSKSPGWSIQAADLSVIFGQQAFPPQPLQESASPIRSQRVLVDISPCPKIFGGSPRDLVSVPFKVYMNSPGGIMRHHLILGHPKG